MNGGVETIGFEHFLFWAVIMKKEKTCEIELMDIVYDEDSPSDEGSLLVRVTATGDVALCCDVDCGSHLARLKKGSRYTALFLSFGSIEILGGADPGTKKIERNEHEGVVSMTGKIDAITGEWVICDVGFPVYAMPLKKSDTFKKGDIVSVMGGLRVELMIADH